MPTNNGSVKNSSAMKPKNVSFKKRKDCIKKKTMELSVLCDVKACALIIGPDGKMETWPENCHDVLEVLRAFQNSDSKDCKRMKRVAEVGNDAATLEVVPQAFQNSDTRGCKRMKRVAEVRNDAAMLNVVPEDQGLPSTSDATEEEKQGLPSTLDVVHEKKQQGFPITLAVADREEHGLPRTSDADDQEEQGLLRTLNATDEKELEFEHEIDGWFNWEYCLRDSTALINQSEFDEWMNIDWECSIDDHRTQVNQSDWLNDYLIEQPPFNTS